MTPSVKLNSIAFGASTAVVFAAWMEIFKLSQLYITYKVILGGLISLGLYRLIATGIIYLVKKNNRVK
ncbi:MAG: hypothetical protein EBU01_17025, partial [Crocinitomicaceae bacterium]|nr:hypothetical protein [Crocinitomicaceae bacterium]